MFSKLFKVFSDKSLEKKYCDESLNSVKNVLYFSLSFFALNTILVISSDVIFRQIAFSLSNSLILSRSLFIFLTIIIILVIKIAKDMKMLNYAIAIFYILLSFTNYITHFSQPNDEVITYALELTIIISIYLVFPVNLPFRLFGALLFTVSYVIALLNKTLPTEDAYQATLLIITSNITGFFIARYLNITLRRIYLKLENFRIMQSELELAKNDLNIFKGIIPICASCKKIRDDSGFWNQLESYFKKVSNVNFIGQECPSCQKKENLDA